MFYYRDWHRLTIAPQSFAKFVLCVIKALKTFHEKSACPYSWAAFFPSIMLSKSVFAISVLFQSCHNSSDVERAGTAPRCEAYHPVTKPLQRFAWGHPIQESKNAGNTKHQYPDDTWQRSDSGFCRQLRSVRLEMPSVSANFVEYTNAACSWLNLV